MNVKIFIPVFTILVLTTLACGLFSSTAEDAPTPDLGPLLTGTALATAQAELEIKQATVDARLTADAQSETDSANLADTAVPTDTSPPAITNTPLPTDPPEPTVPSVPTLGPIIFFDPDSESEMDEYPNGTTQVYACFEYWNLSPDARISGYLYLNGKEINNISGVFELEGNDYTCIPIGSATRKLDHGTWKLSLFLENDLAQSASFKVLR
jgi:hypothetical protein